VLFKPPLVEFLTVLSSLSESFSLALLQSVNVFDVAVQSLFDSQKPGEYNAEYCNQHIDFHPVVKQWSLMFRQPCLSQGVNGNPSCDSNHYERLNDSHTEFFVRKRDADFTDFASFSDFHDSVETKEVCKGVLKK